MNFRDDSPADEESRSGVKSWFSKVAPVVAAFASQNLVPLVMTSATVLIYFWFFFQISTVQISVETGQETELHFYWAEEGGKFSETRSRKIIVPEGETVVRADIDRISPGDRFRLDTGRTVGWVRILDMRMEGRHAPRVFPLEGQNGPEARGHAEVVYDSGPGVLVKASSEDPQVWWDGVVFSSVGEEGGSPLLMDLLVLICFAVFWVLLDRAFPLIREKFFLQFYFVPILLLVVSGGVWAISFGSEKGNHPDERMHAVAGSVYMDHLILPRADDPSLRHTYSGYGYSRLNSPEIAYFLAARFANLLPDAEKIDVAGKLRLYNATLFLVLALASFLHVRFRILLIPLLCSPQFWYLFGYFNSDATSLAACYLIAFATIHPRGWPNRLSLAERTPGLVGWIAVACLLGALAGLLKENYWPFGGFLAGYLLVRAFFHARRKTKIRWITATVLALFCGLIAHNAWVASLSVRNEMPIGEMIEKMHVETAEPEFLNTASLDEKYPFLQLKDRGVPLSDLFVIHRWHDNMVMNSFGNYRFLNVRPDLTFTYRMFWAASAVLFFLFVPAFFRVSWEDRLIALGGLAVTAFVLWSVIRFAWVHDFQAQGRYLAGLLPVIGCVFFALQKKIVWGVIWVLLTVLVSAGLFSFFLYAIPFE